LSEDQVIPAVADQRQEPALLDGVLCNGVDGSAERRSHMRELTMARQAAERRHARPASETGLDRAAQVVAARARAVELRAELERIDAEHRTWLRARGEHVPDPPTRRHKLKTTE
jgi:hypothetical protein